MLRSALVVLLLAALLPALAFARPAATAGHTPDPAPRVPTAPNSAGAKLPPAAPGSAAGTLRPADPATAALANSWFDHFATGWSPNRGQVGAPGQPGSDVLFSASIPGAQVAVTTHGLSHVFVARQDHDADADADAQRAGPRREAAEPMEWSRLDLDLTGAVIRPDAARMEEPLTGQGGTNYYLPQCPDGVLDVPIYGRVTFPDVYPGIDWVVTSEPGRGVHHDFVVHPGADPSRIRLEYKGATGITLDADQRTLHVRTALGEVREGALRCTQADGASVVGARFRVTGTTVGVELDAYDRTRTLVVDPPLVWSTYYGGNNWDGPRTVFCDNANDAIYIVGYTASNTLPLLNPGGGTWYQGVSNGLQDGFIWKFTQAGVRLWATYYGGTGYDTNTDCTVDAGGNLYVVGSTTSTDLPLQVLSGAYNQPTNVGNQSGYILKFGPSGARQWATYFGGAGDDYVTGVTTDAAGKLYVCGSASSPNLPVANPGGGAYYQPANGGTRDGFIARFGTGDALEWSTYYGGEADDEADGIIISGSNLFVTGYTMSTTFPTQNPGGGAYFQPANAGAEDGYALRFTTAGVRSWATYFGGSGSDYADEPIVDATGNLFVSGYSASTDLPLVNPGGSAYFQSTPGGFFDLLVAKFSPTLADVWTTYIGGSNAEYPMGSWGKPMALDALGRLYLTSATFSPDFPVLNPGGGAFYQGTFGGALDAVLMQFTNGGQMLWSTYLGGNTTDFGTSVGIGNGGCLFMTGETWAGGTFPTVNIGFGAWYQAAGVGSDEGYISKFCSPNSACCVDNTCIPVSSQSQCTALGGTAFFPNQPCSTTVCSILCNICGRKFNDLNRNGVQDGGEPGLANWTIELRYVNGTLYAQTSTDASGNYCFNGIPCGSWLVTELQQPGWVQTWPGGGGHTVTLGTGTTQNAVNFGNVACGTGAPCTLPPTAMAAWWPFDDGPGSTSALDVAHADPARNAFLLGGGGGGGSGGSAPGTLCLASPADAARAPAASLLGIDFGAGSFSVATWLDVSSSSASPRVILDRRAGGGALGGPVGWALTLDGQQAMFELDTGGSPQVVPGPSLPADAWTHLVVVVDRKAGQGRWYLDGAHIPAYDFAPAPGSVSNGADLSLGQPNAAFGTAPGVQGCVADLALFSAPLDAAAVAKAFGTGWTSWCPDYAKLPKVTTICKDRTSAQVCFSICNSSASSQSYHWSLAGLPAGPGCTIAGPTNFSPSAGTIVVPAGSCSPTICTTIQRPAGLTAQNATSCFALTYVNDATGACHAQTATLRADNTCWCVTPAASAASVPARSAGGAVIGIGVGYPCDPIATIGWRVHAEWLDPDHADPLAVSLDGLPPGTPSTGSATAGLGADGSIAVRVRYPNGYDPTARYELVVEGDTDGDGTLERLGSTLVAPTYDSTGTASAPAAPAPERSLRLATRPNPFLGSSTIGFTLSQSETVELGVYDLGGRLVRSLARGTLGPGTHRFEWNGRDNGGRRAAAGVYFVRLDGAGRSLQTKLVKMQ